MKLVVLLFAAGSLWSQSQLPIGAWKAHLPYSAGISVSLSEEEVIYASPEGLVFLDKEDLAPRFFSKVDGLSQANIATIHYHGPEETLVVCYENGLIDLLKNGAVTVLRDIADFRNFPIGKRINRLYSYDDDRVLLAAEYGLSRLDVRRGIFEFTVFTSGIDAEVSDALVLGDDIYMATDRGLFRGADVPGSNLSDLSFWRKLGPEEDLPETYSCEALAVYEGVLYASISGGLYAFDGDGFYPVYEEAGYALRVLSAEGGHLLAGFRCEGDCQSRVIAFDGQMNRVEAGGACVDRVLGMVEDSDGRVWYADEYRGIRYAESVSEPCTRLSFNTPFTKDVTDIEIYDNEVYVASGGVTDIFSYLFRDRGYYSLVDGDWSYYNPGNVEIFREKELRDFYKLAVDPIDGSVWAGTFWGGVTHQSEAGFAVYDKENSSLQGILGDEQRTRVGGLVFDEEGLLWVSNFGAPRPVSVRDRAGDWKSFAIPGSSTFVEDVLVDRNGYKWFILIDRTQGVLVFDEGDLDVDGDERWWIFTESNSALPTNETNSLAMDHSGHVWVGTKLGPVVFENCGDRIFSGECTGSQRLVDQDGDLDLLLGTEDVLCIAVDGGNRKWFGTRNGVFVQSPTGQEEVHRFTVDNSPLLDNLIFDIAINPDNGEVFIGTAQGLVSYGGEATEGGSSFDDKMVAYPNPVRPEYDGPIAIRGMARDALVKITDMRGRLIRELNATGGQAIWDGRDYNGRRASPGVYLVFANTEDSFGRPARASTKILVVR